MATKKSASQQVKATKVTDLAVRSDSKVKGGVIYSISSAVRTSFIVTLANASQPPTA
jgi:hypothetical protein